MNRTLQSVAWVMALFTAWEGLGGRVMGQSAAPVIPAAAGPTNLPPLPTFRPPTEIFRGWLKMTPAERDQIFAKQPAELRSRLEAKIHEYESMAPDAREARLHATELHEYLQVLVLTPVTNRAAQVASVPVEYRREVAERLTQFDVLPPGLREEALKQPGTAAYFIGPPVPRALPAPVPPPPMPPDPTRRLRLLSAEERERVFASFDEFFELDAADQAKVIAVLPLNERDVVLKTIRQIAQLPKEDRQECLRAMTELVKMNDQQRRVFFASAERWNAMSPAERETWLKLVKHLPPEPPPPPLPPPAAERGGPSVATNPTR